MKKTTLLAIISLICLSLSSAQAQTQKFERAYKNMKDGKEKKATRKFNQLADDPEIGIGAELMLLTIEARKAKKIPEILALEPRFNDIIDRYEQLPPEQIKQLRKIKASKGSAIARHAALQRRAIRLAERINNVLFLDTLNRNMQWEERVREQWDTVRAHVVNRHILTTDYDIATSIINHHSTVVYTPNRSRYWKMRDHIWEYFEEKYSECEMNEFRNDHPGHRYSYDCWFEEARLVFCSDSVENAIAFIDKYPYSGLEYEVIEFILNQPDNRLYAEETKARMKDVHDFYRLARQALDCTYASDDKLLADLSDYIPKFAPRLSAYFLLLNGSDYFFKKNKSHIAHQMLTRMRPLFPDSSVCYLADYDFQVSKTPTIDTCLACLDNPPANLNYRPLDMFNSETQDDYAAVSWDEGEEIYISRRGTLPKKKKKGYFLLRSTRQGNTWTEPVEEPTLSMNNTAVPLSVTLDGLQMLLRSGRNLYIAQRNDEISPWNAPIRISVKLKGIQRAVFSPDGLAIIIEATTRSSTLSGKAQPDLYYSLYDEKYKRFGPARSLGHDINTSKKESNPFLCADGETLYFSSEAGNAYGDLDIYMSKRLHGNWDTWSQPRNLGCQINTIFDDYAFSWVPENGRQAIYTRQNKCTKQFDLHAVDIPASMRPKPFSYLRGQIVTLQGKPVTRGIVEININHGQKIEKIPVSAAGKYRFRLADSIQHVAIYPDIKGYYATRDTSYDVRKLDPGTTFRDTFRMMPALQAEKHFQLRYATFADQKATPSDARLDRELYLLSRFGKRMRARLVIMAHTDTREREAQSMTNQRAEYIRTRLIEKFSYTPDSITIKALGASDLKCPENPSDAACNRRIQIGFTFYKPVKGKTDNKSTDPNMKDSEAPDTVSKPGGRIELQNNNEVDDETNEEDEETDIPYIPEVTKEKTAKKYKKARRIWRKINGAERRERRKEAVEEEKQFEKDDNGN